jgi:hypothetical protein
VLRKGVTTRTLVQAYSPDAYDLRHSHELGEIGRVLHILLITEQPRIRRSSGLVDDVKTTTRNIRFMLQDRRG